MSSKLTILDIAGLLSTKTGKSKAEAERFVKTFVSVVSEGLIADKIVRIKGIGTFKILEVEDRESVDVNTGKRIVIAGHDKCSFTPDKEMKDLVNEPFSFFETTELADGTDFPELNGDTTPEEKESENDTTAEVIEETPESPESVEEPGEVTLPTVEIPPSDTPQLITYPVEKTSDNNKRIGVSTGIVFFMVVAGVLIYMYVSSLYIVPDNRISAEENAVPVQAADERPLEAERIPTVIPADTFRMQEQTINQTEDTSASAIILAKVVIREGNRLTLIAQEYYNHKIFWVYLFDFNQDKIKDPNNIPIGTVIDVPFPAFYEINANNPASIEKARILQTQIVKRYE